MESVSDPWSAGSRRPIGAPAPEAPGRVSVGVKDYGSPDRRHVERMTAAEVTAGRDSYAERQGGGFATQGSGRQSGMAVPTVRR
jgi:hypothetical protein